MKVHIATSVHYWKTIIRAWAALCTKMFGKYSHIAYHAKWYYYHMDSQEWNWAKNYQRTDQPTAQKAQWYHHKSFRRFLASCLPGRNPKVGYLDNMLTLGLIEKQYFGMIVALPPELTIRPTGNAKRDNEKHVNEGGVFKHHCGKTATVGKTLKTTPSTPSVF